MSDFHLSTIALSLYNIVAIGEAKTLSEARASMARRGMLVGLDDLEKAAAELVARSRMIRDGEVLGVTGERGHVVCSRDRDGDGWSGWQIRAYRAPAREPLIGAR